MAAQQPHHLQIAASLAFQSPARLHTIEIAIDVEFQQHRGMIGGPTRRCRFHANEPQIGQVERIDESINHTNWIVLIDPGIRATASIVRDRPLQ